VLAAASSVTIDLASGQHPSVLLPHERERLDHQRGRSCLGTKPSLSAVWTAGDVVLLLASR
jgi:hypothetical protein